jgi:hypothetical protein
MTFAAFEETLTSVSVCGGDIIAASPSIEGRRESVLGVADVRRVLVLDGGGAPKSEKPVARVDLARDGVFATLSDPDDLDMTSWFFDDGTRADLERLKLGGAVFAGVVPLSPDGFLIAFARGVAAAAAPQKPHDAALALRTTLARSFFTGSAGFGSGSGGGVGSFSGSISMSISIGSTIRSRGGDGGFGGGGGAATTGTALILLCPFFFFAFFITAPHGSGGGGGGGPDALKSIKSISSSSGKPPGTGVVILGIS